eukprot:3832842-Amphidinium_carterae.2
MIGMAHALVEKGIPFSAAIFQDHCFLSSPGQSVRLFTSRSGGRASKGTFIVRVTVAATGKN